jgi:ATP-dependent DNA ligase
MAPTLAKAPPIGDDWIHQVKFDGWRTQVHVEDGAATIYSRTTKLPHTRGRKWAGWHRRGAL